MVSRSKNWTIAFLAVFSFVLSLLFVSPAANGTPPPPRVKPAATATQHKQGPVAIGAEEGVRAGGDQRVGGMAQHTCDDPENPCYTASQMVTYLRETSHHFYRFNLHLGLPPVFVNKVKAAHRVWCGKVPVICKWNYRTLKAAYARGHKTGKIDDDITCAIQTWWCLEHAAAMACLGGPGNPLWSCVGGYHPPVTTDIVKDLRRVANVALSCKGYAIYGAFAGAIGGLKGIAIGALNGEAGCMFNAWMENQSK